MGGIGGWDGHPKKKFVLTERNTHKLNNEASTPVFPPGCKHSIGGSRKPNAPEAMFADEELHIN